MIVVNIESERSGLALGGGLELALACDIRIAAQTAKLGLTETKLGIIPGAGGTQRLPRIIGPPKAKELIYTGRILNGQQAYEIRLVNEVVKQNEQLNAAYQRSLEIAQEIVQQGPLAVRMAKQAINKGLEVDLQTGLEVEEGCYDTVLTSEDRIEDMVGYDPEKKNLTSSQILIASTTASFTSRFLLQPIDVIKIRFQLQIEPIRNLTNSKYRTLFQSIRLIHYEEGLRAFWKGHIAAQVLSMTFNSAQMYAFEKVTKQLGEIFPITTSSPTAKTITHFVIGSLAASIAVISCQPTDVLRTRFVGQGEPKIYHSYIQAISLIWTREGYHGFYRGLIPAIILYAPVSALTFGFYELFNRAWDHLPIRKFDSIKHGFNGGIAGVLAKFVVYPFDLAKKRLEVVKFEEARSKFGQTRAYSGLINCLSETIRHEGFTGLYKGMTPSLIKAYLSTAITLGIYDSICNRFRQISSD
ncbi:unnamed protein product [Rotaria sordida]|uniref:Uncharacterized protein n=1 Tax=Rotaria sordida TaxID=392033 RepID=A0A818VHU5_9BILA|nr:unnamed protein product [Rotaria sordida]